MTTPSRHLARSTTGYPANQFMTSHLPPDVIFPETKCCSPRIHRVVAPNPNELTYTGTNSFIVHAPVSAQSRARRQHERASAHAPLAHQANNSPRKGFDSSEPTPKSVTPTSITPTHEGALIIDPGPDIPRHLDALLAQCDERGLRPVALLATHTHNDHAASIPTLTVTHGLPAFTRADGSLKPGPFRIDGLDVELEIIPLPGHSSDSVGVLIPEDRALISGDMIFAHGSTVVVYPDGSLADYLQSLDRLEKLVIEGRVDTLLTGHGHSINDPLPLIHRYRAHRLERIAQTRAAIIDTNSTDPDDLSFRIYPRLAPSLRPVAERTIAAQLAYLAEAGEIDLPLWVQRLSAPD